MKSVTLRIATFLLAVGFVPAGSAVASTEQSAQFTDKPLQLTKFYRSGGYWVCYNKARVYRSGYWRGHYRHYRGIRYVNCRIHRYPCRAYGKHQFGWYRHIRQAQRATWLCHRYSWYRR